MQNQGRKNNDIIQRREVIKGSAQATQCFDNCYANDKT